MEFFVVALPGLEDLVQNEIRDWYPHLKTTVSHGGVSVETGLDEGLSFNLCLKTPTRVLLRIDQFRCRDFPKLYNRVLEIPWSEWLDPACAITVHSATRLSRLKIKKRIEDTVANAWQGYAEKTKVTIDARKKADLYVRLVEDECTLSLDTSGERLHKRGERPLIGEAPLRETIASSLLQMLASHQEKFFPDRRDVELIDPMSGSGTFLLEAWTRDELIDKRNFAFEAFVAQPSIPKLQVTRPKFVRGIGYETDEKTLKAAQGNLSAVIKTGQIELLAQDFFTAAALPVTKDSRWLIANPPYGERIQVSGSLTDFYIRLFAAAARVANPDLACFIVPTKIVKGRFALPANWKVVEKRPFLNGGIPVTAFVFARQA